MTFTLHNGSYTNFAQYPRTGIKFKTDDFGVLKAQLWCNKEGILPSVYRCNLPHEYFDFVIPANTSYAVLSQLRLLNLTDGNIDNCSNATITEYIDKKIKGFIFPFTNLNIVNGWIAVPHKLSNEIIKIVIINDKGLEVQPGDVRIIDSNNCLVEIEPYTPIIGTWKLRVI